jgi:hypothetical protein
MADIFERIKRQYDAWKLEQKYMRRRRNRMTMRKYSLSFHVFEHCLRLRIRSVV